MKEIEDFRVTWRKTISGLCDCRILTTDLVRIFRLRSSSPSIFHDIMRNSEGGFVVAVSRNLATSSASANLLATSLLRRKTFDRFLKISDNLLITLCIFYLILKTICGSSPSVSTCTPPDFFAPK